MATATATDPSIPVRINDIIAAIERQYPGIIAITRKQFYQFFSVSRATDTRMYQERDYPPTFVLRSNDERILVADVARFIASRPLGRDLRRGRGRPRKIAA